MSVDPNDGVLTVLNPTSVSRAYHISLSGGLTAIGRDGPLRASSSSGCTTLSLALGPRMRLDACIVDGQPGPESIASDVVDIVEPSPGLAAPSQDYAFPLAGPGRFLCTQGAGGLLSHFVHPSVYHAVDFACSTGTPVLAIAPGVVETVETSHSESTIHVSGLFRWNRIVLALDDGALAEYVHVAHRSHLVQPGARVVTGQPICRSGDVGFCPQPHLHLEIHLQRHKDAPSVPFALRRPDGSAAVPEAGQWWQGHVGAAPST